MNIHVKRILAKIGLIKVIDLPFCANCSYRVNLCYCKPINLRLPRGGDMDFNNEYELRQFLSKSPEEIASRSLL